ncbi:MAG TPA: hypothetical protein VMB21_16520 [Candidatus Limnocylindria bacterium]|jgi:hypothetical protein|nr:hypothetical protein [Candidatus Limnocylindria bacterium]
MPTSTQSNPSDPMKSVDSARVEQQELPLGRISIRIAHEPIRGVTAPMLRWWFEHIDGESNLTPEGFSGPPKPVYLLWHPHDHIRAAWKKKAVGGDGRIGPGSVLYVEENLGGKHLSKNSVNVTRLDDTAFNFSLGQGAASFGEVRHLYRDTAAGLSLRTEMDFGVQWPLVAKSVNGLLRKKALTPEVIQAWTVHNVEECGRLEKFLPQLYSRG